MGGCSQGQGGTLRRAQLYVSGVSCDGADTIRQADVEQLICAAVPMIAKDYAMNGDGEPTRGNVLSVLFNQWRVRNPDGADEQFRITKALAREVLLTRPAWRDALSERAGGGGDDKVAEKLCDLARSLVHPQKSLLCGKMSDNVRKKKKLQWPGVEWDGVVAWSQSPEVEDEELQRRRESGMARLEVHLSHSAFGPTEGTGDGREGRCEGHVQERGDGREGRGDGCVQGHGDERGEERCGGRGQERDGRITPVSTSGVAAATAAPGATSVVQLQAELAAAKMMALYYQQQHAAVVSASHAQTGGGGPVTAAGTKPVGIAIDGEMYMAQQGGGRGVDVVVVPGPIEMLLMARRCFDAEQIFVQWRGCHPCDGRWVTRVSLQREYPRLVQQFDENPLSHCSYAHPQGDDLTSSVGKSVGSCAMALIWEPPHDRKVRIGCFRFLAGEDRKLRHAGREFSVPRLVLDGLKRVVIRIKCPDGQRRCFAVACETFAMTAAKKVLTLHLKYEPEVASKTLAKARPRKSGRQVMHGVWTLLRGNETPFVLCTAGPTGGPRAKPVGMLAFSVLFHMSSVVGGGRDKSDTHFTSAGMGCAEEGGEIGALAFREGWPLAPHEMIEQAEQGDVWYNRAKDDENLVGEFGFAGPRMYSARDVRVLDMFESGLLKKRYLNPRDEDTDRPGKSDSPYSRPPDSIHCGKC